MLAAANPKFGRFDPHQGIAQQIDLPPTLINRFDIIFTLRDLPNKENDEKIAKHVLQEHLTDTPEMLIPKELFTMFIPILILLYQEFILLKETSNLFYLKDLKMIICLEI